MESALPRAGLEPVSLGGGYNGQHDLLRVGNTESGGLNPKKSHNARQPDVAALFDNGMTRPWHGECGSHVSP
ncbi:MAG: hypothetical protein ACSLFJ_07495 [Immundisolibacter sp.]|uniref:hypothetical protein n=1 Tax=Immundisolibacter sp. TaxID=1934948 RepID=UPI003EE1E7CE